MTSNPPPPSPSPTTPPAKSLLNPWTAKQPTRIRPLAWLGLLLIIPVGYFQIRSVVAPKITMDSGASFRDQQLKTTVALIELHKVRHGKYPKNLSELKFTGEWDQMALQRVTYVVNPEQTAYYVEVKTAWIGESKVQVPADFWQGTGYSQQLRP